MFACCGLDGGVDAFVATIHVRCPATPTRTAASTAPIWQQNYDLFGVNENTYEMGDFNEDGRIDGVEMTACEIRKRL